MDGAEIGQTIRLDSPAQSECGGRAWAQNEIASLGWIGTVASWPRDRFRTSWKRCSISPRSNKAAGLACECPVLSAVRSASLWQATPARSTSKLRDVLKTRKPMRSFPRLDRSLGSRRKSGIAHHSSRDVQLQQRRAQEYREIAQRGDRVTVNRRTEKPFQRACSRTGASPNEGIPDRLPEA